MPDNMDTMTVGAPDAVEVSVFCDRCTARLVATGATQQQAHAKLFAMITERNWRVVDRLTGSAPVATSRVPDLCCHCTAKS
jgi:3-methyladenine DNA glycosylase AlkD